MSDSDPGSKPTTLVLDAGKTHVKLCAVDASGRIAERVVCATPIRRSGPYPHIDTDTLGAWLLDALATLGARYPVRTIVPTAHGACAAVLSGDALALPIMDYEWTGITADDDYGARRPPFTETRSPALPGGLNLGRQLYWLQVHQENAFAEVDAIVCYPQFWAWWLSGERVGEVTSLGAHSDLWNPSARCLSSLVHAQGWASRFLSLRPAWQPAGVLRPALARRTGLAAECRVLTGLHDSNASYLRHLVSREKPFTVISTGTWIIMMAAGGDLQRLEERFDTLANVDVYGDPVPSARFMGGREYAAIAGDDGVTAVAGVDDLTRIIEQESLALPSFADAGGPFGGRRGVFAGPPAQTATEKTALAALYCALVCDYSLDKLGADRGDLIIEGSFARNAAFCSVLARLREQPVLISDDETGTVTGAALLAGDWPPRDYQATHRPAGAMALPGIEAYKTTWRRAVQARGSHS